MESEPGIISKFYTSLNTLLTILEGQGYDVREYKGMSIQQAAIMYKTGQSDLMLTGTKGKIFVKYNLGTSLKPNALQTMIDTFYEIGTDTEGNPILSKDDQLMIIVKEEPNDTLRHRLFTLYAESGIFVTVLNLRRLQYNILEHEIVPKHTVLSEEEKQSILKHYCIQDFQLPEISRFDPVAMLIGLRPKMVCRIDRKSKTAVTAEYYRICV